MKKAKILIVSLFFPFMMFSQTNEEKVNVVKMEGAVNFRDIGGYKTQDGKTIVTGKLFRSADISKLTNNDMKIMEENHIYTVIDFRGKKESAAAPDRLLPNTDYTLCPSGSDNIPDTKKLEELVKDDNFLLSMYNSQSIRYYGERYKPMFQKLLSLPESNSSLLYHCTGGRDRTGMATALLLYVLGVPMKTIETDFVASNIYLTPVNKEMFKPMVQLSGFSESEIEERMKLRPELIRSFFKSISDEYGSIENFMEKELGVGNKEIAFLKQKYTK